MTEIDFDRLGDVWRRQPDPAEMARLQRTAVDVARRARWGYALDIVAAVAVAAVVIILVASNPRIETVLMGGGAILLLLASNVRQRKLRKVELRSLTGSTEDMLDQSIERVETRIKHSYFSLAAVGPALLIGGLVAASAGAWRGGSVVPVLNDIPLLRTVWLGVAIAMIAGVVTFSILAIRRGRRELGRLTAMREAYRDERESTGP